MEAERTKKSRDAAIVEETLLSFRNGFRNENAGHSSKGGNHGKNGGGKSGNGWDGKNGGKGSKTDSASEVESKLIHLEARLTNVTDMVIKIEDTED